MRSILPNLLAVMAGLGLLGGVEALLQIAEVGPPNRLFLKSVHNGQEVYSINRLASHRFFPPQYQRTISTQVRFNAQKPPNTVRIFALGASTLLGFPNPPRTSFPHFLELMLKDAYPGRQFEVLNCGITAINTFCLLDFMDEIVAYDPDLVIIYTGHNEFVGPYGVTTPFVRMGNDRTWIRLYMWVQRTKIYHYLKEFFHWMQSRGQSPKAEFSLRIFDQEIGALDEGRRTTRENYRENLTALLHTAGEHQVPVVLSTLASNMQFYPFRSTCDASSLGYRLGLLERQGRLDEAVKRCKEAVEQAPHCANLHYELGRLHYRQTRFEAAHQAFVRARDLDRLPFRAPSGFNQLIRNLASDLPPDQVLLNDAETALETASKHGITGSDLMTEYLHPTVKGHYLIAENVLKGLVQSPISTSWGQADTTRLHSYEDYGRHLGYTLPEQIFYRTGLMLFLSRMPYKEPPAILRRHVASLMFAQIREVPKLNTEQRQDFVRQSLPVLLKLLNFLLIDDRRALAGALSDLGATP